MNSFIFIHRVTDFGILDRIDLICFFDYEIGYESKYS
jgi:hypothetical protein